MKYRATKTVVRHLNNKQSTILKIGEVYTDEVVEKMPKWYLTDGYLTPIE